MDDDVIGSAPAPRRPARPRRRPVLAGPRDPGIRRALAAVAVLAAIAGVVVAGRAGLRSADIPVAAAPTDRPVLGRLLQLVAGADTIYALVDDCTPTPATPPPGGSGPSAGEGRCVVRLLVSGSEGRTWDELPLPGPPPTPAAVRAWILRVSGAEDQLSIQDPVAGVVRLGTTAFTTARRVVAGPPLASVPAGRESLTGLCPPPRCPVPAVEFLEARTGVRSRLAVQPPFPPAVVTVEDSQLWVAGTDPRTGRYAVAVSTDDAVTWRSAPLPGAAPAPDVVARLVPVPEEDAAYLVLCSPGPAGLLSIRAIWNVPDPRGQVTPVLVRPDTGTPTVDSLVGLRDGRLALAGGGPQVIAPDGVVERPAAGDGAPPGPRRWLQRGPHLLVVAEAGPSRTAPTAIRLVTSVSGRPDDWQLRPLTLPL